MSDAYSDALNAAGLEDVQPRYRQLLLKLKAEDATAYEDAVARYRADVESAAAESTDVVRVWLDYGAWLAEQIAPGRLVTIAENGRADAAPRPAPAT